MTMTAEQRRARILELARAVLVHNDQDALQLAPLLRAAVSPPKQAVGRLALELLPHRAFGTAPSPVQHIALLPELTIRSSCGTAG